MLKSQVKTWLMIKNHSLTKQKHGKILIKHGHVLWPYFHFEFWKYSISSCVFNEFSKFCLFNFKTCDKTLKMRNNRVKHQNLYKKKIIDYMQYVMDFNVQSMYHQALIINHCWKHASSNSIYEGLSRTSSTKSQDIESCVF